MAKPQQSGSEGKITVEFHNNIAVVTLRRGQNRHNAGFVNDFNKALDQVER